MSEKRPRNGLLSRIAAPIAKLVRRSGSGGLDEMTEEEAAREMAQAGQLARETPPVPPQSLTSEDFTLAMGQLLNEGDGKFGTKLQVISLVEFREAVGERWSKVADKVMMIAEGVINMHIGPGNIFSRQGSDFFVLLFRTCVNAEGRRRALIIAQELGTRLVGDQFQGIERPLALAAELDVADALRDDGSLDLGALDHAVNEMRSLIAKTITDKASRGWVPPAAQSETGLRRHMMPSGPMPVKAPPPARPPIAVTAERPAAPAEDPGWKEITRKGPASVSAWVEADRRGPEPLVGNGIPPLTSESKLSLLWRPTWIAATETIGAYRAQIQRVDRAGQPALEGTRAYPSDHVESINVLDRYGIACAIRDFRASEDIGNDATAIIAVHWQTLAAGNRMDFLAPFANLTQGSRAARVAIDLFGVPDRINPAFLAEIIRATKPLCRDIMLRGRLTVSRAKLAADCGANLIGIDLSELTPGERTDDAHLITGLRHFLDSAGECGLGAYVWGVRRRTMVVDAVQAGFAMVNGAALMKDIARPAKQLPAPKARFTAPGG
jgi:hypothetical protein